MDTITTTELFKLGAQLGVGAFMGVVMIVVMFLMNRSQLTSSENRHSEMLTSFSKALKEERDRNDRNLGYFFARLDKLTDVLEQAKCRYNNGQAIYQYPPSRRPPEAQEEPKT